MDATDGATPEKWAGRGRAEDWLEAYRNRPESSHGRSVRRIALGAAVAGGLAAALAALAAGAQWQGRRAERQHPPVGEFINVDGVLLHYVEAGEGPPVVLLHGNGSLMQDLLLSIFEPLAQRHRVLVFDRPGFGYSDRPKDRAWTPEAQAKLFREACRALGVDRPVLYGHSFGAPVVLAYAMHYPAETRGIVAASGYYYPNFRLDSLLAWLNVLPGIGPVMRNAVMPAEGALLGKLAVKALFDPQPIPPAYEEFPASLSLRPWQIRAAAEDGTTLRAWAKRAQPRYRGIRVPVMIVAGADDKAVDYRGHSLRLHRDIPGSGVRIWRETGHMVHHTRPEEVVDAIETVFRVADEPAPAAAGAATTGADATGAAAARI